jgi:hypothetical protein
MLYHMLLARLDYPSYQATPNYQMGFGQVFWKVLSPAVVSTYVEMEISQNHFVLP